VQQRLNKNTFVKGNQEFFDVSMSSENPTYPLIYSLARKHWYPSLYDNHAEFAAYDPYPVYTITFTPKDNCSYHLKFLRGQLTTHEAGQNVEVTAFNGATALPSTVEYYITACRSDERLNWWSLVSVSMLAK
jgi:hypothetical protein